MYTGPFGLAGVHGDHLRLNLEGLLKKLVLLGWDPSQRVMEDSVVKGSRDFLFAVQHHYEILEGA